MVGGTGGFCGPVIRAWPVLGIFLPQVGQALQRKFSCRQALLRRRECSGPLSQWIFALPLWEAGRDFSLISSENLVGKTHKHMPL